MLRLLVPTSKSSKKIQITLIRYTLLLAAILLGFTGCWNHAYMSQNKITGNGDIITETREVGHFTELRVTGARHTIVYGNEDGPIRLTGDSNILDQTLSYVDGDRLVITSRDNTFMEIHLRL